MLGFAQSQRQDALAVVDSSIRRCQQVQPKFAPGSSQHSLLRNRLRALSAAKALLLGETPEGYTEADLKAALPPLASIRRKCSKAQEKHPPGSPFFTRFERTIRAMEVAEALVKEELERRQNPQ